MISPAVSESIERYHDLLSGANPDRVPIYARVGYKDGIMIPRWGAGSRPSELRKIDLFSNPELHLDWQLQCIADRMDMALGDDWIPSLNVWYGTGVLASAFGCPVEFQPDLDPWARPAIYSAKDVYSLARPDLRRSGLTGRVLETIGIWQDKTEGRVPTRVNNDQGPLDVATQVLDFTEFLTGMYEHPREIHYLLSLVTDTILEWQEIQEEAIENVWHGGWEHWTPEGGGALLCDDVLVNLSPALYEEFGVPYNSRVSRAFGGAFVHYCASPGANPLHNLETLLTIDGFKGLETQFLSVEELTRVRDVFDGRAVILGQPPPGLDVREHLALMQGAKHILYLDSMDVTGPEEVAALKEKIAAAREFLEGTSGDD